MGLCGVGGWDGVGWAGVGWGWAGQDRAGHGMAGLRLGVGLGTVKVRGRVFRIPVSTRPSLNHLRSPCQ